MVTNKEVNERRDPDCLVVFADKKYFRVGSWFMKRTLRRHEWQSTVNGRLVVPPAALPQRWKNDAAVLRFLREHTDIPLPPAECTFEDDGAFYIQTQFVEGINMAELTPEQKDVVTKELLQHNATLKALRSDTPGVPGETLLCPPSRVTGSRWKMHSCWKYRQQEEKQEFVFCHNDLGQHNIIVDPDTLKIKAILDWEFGGFWPEWFERAFWKRHGPSVALEGEEDDTDRCREWLVAHCDEVVMPHLGNEETVSS